VESAHCQRDGLRHRPPQFGIGQPMIRAHDDEITASLWSIF
jgi:hypothetical protein